MGEYVTGRERICPLYHMAPVHREGDPEDVTVHGIRRSGLLNLCPVREQFLDDLVSKNVLNEREGVVGNDVVEVELLLIAGGGPELLLDE